MTIDQAKEYFGDTVDYYHDGGSVINQAASSLFRYHDGDLTRLR